MTEKQNIKIFVSHRTDLDADTIDNPLYCNIRSGAVNDKRTNVATAGDDTGDNISEKSDTYGYLTVLYWAWKNIDADYYGFCNYNKYISFSYNEKGNDNGGYINEPQIDEKLITDNNLDETTMREVIGQFDIVTCSPIDVQKVNPCAKTVQQYLDQLENVYFNKKDLSILINSVEKNSPEYVRCMHEYLGQNQVYINAYFIIKKKIFNDFCAWAFKILQEVEIQRDTAHYSKRTIKELALFFVFLYGVYLTRLKKENDDLKIKESSVIFIKNVKKEPSIEPFKNDAIPLVIFTSDYYVPFTSVYLLSLLAHISEKRFYDIVILHRDVTEENQRVVRSLAQNYKNVSIRFYNPRKYFARRKLHLSFTTATEETYYRLVAPWVMSGYEKVIYTDSDAILREDIADFYDEIKLDDKYLLAAAKDIVVQGWLNTDKYKMMKYVKNDLKKRDPYSYINAGVLVYNAEKIREEYTAEQLLDYAEKCNFIYQDQDLINNFYDERIKSMTHKWNMCLMVNSGIEEDSKNAPAEDLKAYCEALKNPGLVHWANAPKPWQVLDLPFAHEWWENARKSPYYEILIDRKMQGLCTNVINQLVPNSRPFVRRVADKVLPAGSRRRSVVKKLIPRDSPQWNFLKKIYNMLKL